MRESYKLLPKKTLNLLYGDLDFGEPALVVGGNVKNKNTMRLEVKKDLKISPIKTNTINPSIPQWKSIIEP